jgi:hypothetical protein
MYFLSIGYSGDEFLVGQLHLLRRKADKATPHRWKIRIFDEAFCPLRVALDVPILPSRQQILPESYMLAESKPSF